MTCKKPYSSPVILSVLMRNEISIEIDHVDRDWDDIAPKHPRVVSGGRVRPGDAARVTPCDCPDSSREEP